MSQGPPNPGFRSVKVKNGVFMNPKQVWKAKLEGALF